MMMKKMAFITGHILNIWRNFPKPERRTIGALFYLREPEWDRELASVIRKELPKDVVRVHFDHGSFGLFCEKDNKALVEMMSQVIKDAATEHNVNNPDAPINLSISHKKREKDESPAEFFNRIGA